MYLNFIRSLRMTDFAVEVVMRNFMEGILEQEVLDSHKLKGQSFNYEIKHNLRIKFKGIL